MKSIRYYAPGIILMALAIMIVAVPEILVVLVASAVMMAAISLLCIGHILKKYEEDRLESFGWHLEKGDMTD